MSDWYSKNGFRPRTSTPSSNNSTPSAPSSNSGGGGGGSSSQVDIIKAEMAKNSSQWGSASPAQRKVLEARNQELGKMIGGSYDPSTGKWSFGGSGGSSSGGGGANNSLRDIAAQYGFEVGFNPNDNTVVVYNPASNRSISFQSGMGGQFGMGGLQDGFNVVSNPQALFRALSGPEPTQFDTLMSAFMARKPVTPQMPNIDDIYSNILRSKQSSINLQKQNAQKQFEDQIVPQLRAELAASGFLNSDARFEHENRARQGLMDTFASIQAQAEADALQEALSRAGLEANMAMNVANFGQQQDSLMLDALGQMANQAYQQGMLNLQRDQFDYGKLSDLTEWSGRIAEGLPGAGQQTLAGRRLDNDIQYKNIATLLEAIGLMGRVPNVGGEMGQLLQMLGLSPGSLTADYDIANRELALNALGLSMGGGGGGGGGSSRSGGSGGSSTGNFTKDEWSVMEAVMGAGSAQDAKETLNFYRARLSPGALAYINEQLDAKYGTKGGTKDGTKDGIISKIIKTIKPNTQLKPKYTNEYPSEVKFTWDNPITRALGFTKDNPHNVFKWPW